MEFESNLNLFLSRISKQYISSNPNQYPYGEILNPNWLFNFFVLITPWLNGWNGLHKMGLNPNCFSGDSSSIFIEWVCIPVLISNS